MRITVVTNVFVSVAFQVNGPEHKPGLCEPWLIIHDKDFWLSSFLFSYL